MENNRIYEETANHSCSDSTGNQPLRSDASTAQVSASQSITGSSYFDGKTIQLIGWRLLGLLLTGITLGIGAPWAQCMILRWEAQHTVVEGKRLCFTGRGLQLLGNYLLWGLLTVITLGIYAIFIPVRMQKWRVSHTCFDTGKEPPKQDVSAGLVIGVIGGIALLLAVAIAAVLFFLPKQDASFFPSRIEPNQSQSGHNDPVIHTQATSLEETGGDTPEILYVVANGGLNLRAGPGQEYDVISNLPDGTMVTVQKRQDGWVFTGEGWCSADYLNAEAPTSNISSVEALFGNWMVISDFSRDEYSSWCRGGSITLNGDGTFTHGMRDYCNFGTEFGWYCPGGETSGGDCPYWKGTYVFTGSHLTLNYQYEQVSEYTYAQDGSPIYQGSHWEPVYRSVTLRVSMTDYGDLALAYAAEIPIYTENTQGSTNTHTALYRLPGGSDTFQDISDGLNRILPH